MTYAVNKQGSWLNLAVVLLIAQRTDQCDLCVIIISILAMRDQQINSKRVGWGAVAMKTSHFGNHFLAWRGTSLDLLAFFG